MEFFDKKKHKLSAILLEIAKIDFENIYNSMAYMTLLVWPKLYSVF